MQKSSFQSKPQQKFESNMVKHEYLVSDEPHVREISKILQIMWVKIKDVFILNKYYPECLIFSIPAKRQCMQYLPSTFSTLGLSNPFVVFVVLFKCLFQKLCLLKDWLGWGDFRRYFRKLIEYCLHLSLTREIIVHRWYGYCNGSIRRMVGSSVLRFVITGTRGKNLRGKNSIGSIIICFG